jgi:hypothetical protein
MPCGPRQRWKGASPSKEAAHERSVHRGRCGASLETPRAGRPGSGGLAARSDFDKPRCREASRSVGPSGPLASRAPSHFVSGQRGNELEYGLPGAAKNTGEESCLVESGEGRHAAPAADQTRAASHTAVPWAGFGEAPLISHCTAQPRSSEPLFRVALSPSFWLYPGRFGRGEARHRRPSSTLPGQRRERSPSAKLIIKNEEMAP